MANEAPQFLEYKGKALVRQGDSICYGNMSDKHILSLMIMAYKINYRQRCSYRYFPPTRQSHLPTE